MRMCRAAALGYAAARLEIDVGSAGADPRTSVGALRR